MIELVADIETRSILFGWMLDGLSDGLELLRRELERRRRLARERAFRAWVRREVAAHRKARRLWLRELELADVAQRGDEID